MPASKKKTTAAPQDSSCPHPLGTLISIGGHERKDVSQGDTSDVADNTILRRVVNEIGSRGPILVLPIASEEPVEAGVGTALQVGGGCHSVQRYDQTCRAQAGLSPRLQEARF